MILTELKLRDRRVEIGYQSTSALVRRAGKLDGFVFFAKNNDQL